MLIMHGLLDLPISVAYLAIPVTILRAVRARPDLLDPKVATLFSGFITACALSHLTGLLTLWVPAYGFQGAVKVATAAVSMYTAAQPARMLPGFLTRPSRLEMANASAEIAGEQRRNQEAQEARDKLSEFAHIPSHDLKAPMRGIANQARFLLEDHGEKLEPNAHRRLEQMQDLSSHLEGLIGTLLKYSRIGKSDARESVDSALVVERIRASLSELLLKKMR
ncbi:MAG: histidine kinase dimerization/phospho-acceptor domain-containing protein [Roseobacter sp.]